MLISVKCFVVLLYLNCFVQHINSELCSESSPVLCKDVNFQNTSEINSFNSEQFPSSILYGLSVLAIQSTNSNGISNCVQQLISIIEAVKTKEIWALKSKKSHN